MSTAAENIPTPPIATIMRALTSELPLNDFGLPTGIYRSDLLPFHLYDPTVTVSRDPHDVPEIVAPLLPAVDAEDTLDSPESPDSGDAQIESREPSVDPFSLLSGQGDGLPDMIMPKREAKPDVMPGTVPSVGDYRIAGFPAAEIQKAFVPLLYDEGFPSFDTGSAFWDQLPFEPHDAYLAFERYKLMSGGRAPGTEDIDDEGRAAEGTRSIGKLIGLLQPQADDVRITALSDKLNEYYHLYYWGLRTRSYDLFKVTQHHQQQELRAIETQDDHYVKSRKMRARLEEYMDDDEDFWDMMTPKTALDMHKHLTQLERVSAGVPAAGPATKESEQKGQSFEMQFATVAQAHKGDTGDGTLLNEEGEVLDRALEDPGAVEVLQKLIIRTGGG